MSLAGAVVGAGLIVVTAHNAAAADPAITTEAATVDTIAARAPNFSSGKARRAWRQADAAFQKANLNLASAYARLRAAKLDQDQSEAGPGGAIAETPAQHAANKALLDAKFDVSFAIWAEQIARHERWKVLDRYCNRKHPLKGCP